MTDIALDDPSPRIAGEAKKIAPKELKELKRVYDKLCLWSDKLKLVDRIRSIDCELQVLRNKVPNDATSKSTVSEKIEELQTTKNQYEVDLNSLYNASEKIIRVQDTAAAFRSLGRKLSKREVLDIIWEVDEKLDNVIDWEEFLLMYSRNVHDNTGLEPSAFYHMVQFMIYDCDDNGKVSIDETMNMLYPRLGREKMEEMISLLFGDGDGCEVVEKGQQGGEIDFCRYWNIVVKEQMKMFRQSDLCRNLPERKKKR